MARKKQAARALGAGGAAAAATGGDDDETLKGSHTYTRVEPLAAALSKAWHSKEFTDAKVIAGEGDDQQTFQVNAPILAWRSEYFHNAFFGGYAETSEKVLRKPNVSPRVMAAMLEFCYSGHVQLDDDAQFTLELILASDELGLFELSKAASKDLTGRMTAETAVDYLESAYSQNVRALQETCLEHVLVNAPDFLERLDEVFSLPQEAILDMVSHPKLPLAEEDVWHFMVNYATHETGVTETDPVKWTDVEKEKLKPVMSLLLPHLRLFLVDAETMSKELEPSGFFSQADIFLKYKQAMVPSSVPADHKWLQIRESTVDRRLISPTEFATLRKWIGKRARWVSLYRATTDGFSASTFHRLCDNQGPTVTFVQVGNFVAGGYAADPWSSSNQYVSSPNTFLFSVSNPSKQPMVQFTCTHNPTNAMFCHQNYMPTFGGGHDLYLCDNCNTSNGSYTGLGSSFTGSGASNNFLFGSYNFTVNEIVVYALK